ncbi:MAG: hypothetical protein Q8L86_19155 [Vicinamibacterales bacterium]|nr:hypothetical protein [Vicinamibacterales bacterium]
MGIFLVGLGVSTLCLFGLYFTIAEMSRLGRNSDGRPRAQRQ